MRFQPAKTYPAKVVFTDIDGAEYELNLIFRRLNSVAIQDFGHRMQELSKDKDDDNEHVVKLLSEVVAGWTDVVNENDLPVPYTPEALQEFLLSYYTAILPIANAYIDSVDSRKKKH